ncbi:unnamed protein product [Adineta ricciae]|uniref:Uncharacterized protein n=1 Tax=Adineta ricciae TaxID=249248 RepID=A0A814HB37_ADIRI|nr:unnamed protein product [Adineta ricciae]
MKKKYFILFHISLHNQSSPSQSFNSFSSDVCANSPNNTSLMSSSSNCSILWCSYVRAQIQEDDETSLFPIDPIIRYIRSYTRERWYESLEVLLKNQLSLSSTIGYCQFPGRTIPYSDPIGSETWISWIFQGSS